MMEYMQYVAVIPIFFVVIVLFCGLLFEIFGYNFRHKKYRLQYFLITMGLCETAEIVYHRPLIKNRFMAYLFNVFYKHNKTKSPPR